MTHFRYRGIYMRVAIPVRDGMIEKKAEDALSVILYDIEEDEILSEETVRISGEENIVNTLLTLGVDTFLCLSLGPKMVVDLALKDIQIIGGVRGKAKDAVRRFVSGTLEEEDLQLDCIGSGCNGDCSRCH